MAIHLTFFLLGIGLLILGSEGFIAATQRIAGGLRMRASTAGIFIIGFGTSMPELVTSVEGARMGSDGIVIGNIVGSNIANLLLLAGIAALILPLGGRWRFDLGILGLGNLLFAGFALAQGGFNAAAAVLGILLITFYVLARLRGNEDKEKAVAPSARTNVSAWLFSALLLIGGFAIMLIGAQMMIERGMTIARMSGVSESLLGLTSIALGTSLPELGAIAASLRRRQGGFVLGNLIGSCIFNLLLVLPAAALIQSLRIPPDILAFDLWVMLLAYGAVSVLLLTGDGLSRRQGALLTLAYVVWLGTQISGPLLR